MLQRALVIIGLATVFAAGTASGNEAGFEVGFSDREIKLIRAWYTSHDGYGDEKKAGKKGGKSLPPGVARNLARGHSLPPGIAKKQLPNGLLEILPPVPRGFERIEVAGRVLLIEVATQVIQDVLEDLILR